MQSIHNLSLFSIRLNPIPFPGTYNNQVIKMIEFLLVSYILSMYYPPHSGFGGLEVTCCPWVPKFAGSQPTEAVGFLGRKKSPARLPSEGEVKPSVPCRSFTVCKRSLNVTCESAFRQNFQTFLAHSSTFPPLGALAWWHAWSRLVAKVGTSNPDRKISLEGYSE
jgi:hypothetical protein